MHVIGKPIFYLRKISYMIIKLKVFYTKSIAQRKIFFFGENKSIVDQPNFEISMAEQEISELCSSKSTKRLFHAIVEDEEEETIQTLLQEYGDIDGTDSEGYIPLLLACTKYEETIVDRLVKSGANVNICDRDGNTVLHYAIRYRWEEIARYLVKKVVDVDARNITGETPLHLASGLGRLEIVKCLLEEGADVERKNLADFTPLLCAAQSDFIHVFDFLKSIANVDGNERLLLYFASLNQWTETIQYLVKRVPDLNERYVIGETDFNARSSGGHLELLKCLVRGGTELNTRMIIQAALHKASCMGHIEVVKWIVIKGAEMQRILNFDAEVHDKTALFWASSGGHLKVVKCLVEEEADINPRDLFGQTALRAALENRHLETVRYLLEKGAKINTPDMFGVTALHIASEEGHLEIVRCLLEKGAEINTGHQMGGVTALHLASEMGHLEVVRCLLDKGAKIDMGDITGYTALHKASVCGHLDIIRCLLDKGADVEKKNISGSTALLWVASVGHHKNAFDLLMHLGANVNVSNRNKMTPLHCASANGWLDVVICLVKRECNLDAKTSYEGMTALAFACQRKKLDIVEYLLQAGACWDTADKNGNSPLNYLTRKDTPDFEFFKLFIENGGYLKPVDYDAIVKSSSLKVLQDVKLCLQSIINQFNNHDLPELYKVASSQILLPIEKMQIASCSEVAQAIEKSVGFEIQTKGHCNILDAHFRSLSIFSIRSFLENDKIKK